MGKLQLLLIPIIVAVLGVHTRGSFAEEEKLRVLSLHGYMGNGPGMCSSYKSWDPAILELVEFSCLTAPFPVTCRGRRNNCYSWFNHDSDRVKSKIDESLAYVLDYMRETGPYDGVMGHSQGGMMAGLLTGVQAKEMVILGRMSGDLPALRFAIIDEGGFLPGLLEDVYCPPLETKSFHIIGNYDPNQQTEEEFLPKWQNPTVVYVDMPHTPLTGQYMNDELKRSLEDFLNTARGASSAGGALEVA
ncbi:hypothetical protein R1flu_023845 [Riccia fluitans]|uniref:Serine hydrolase domain-containing protein n=1 Tax=Riccia fluitans TaxID=41844 RepID=A0ABD1XU15_9MARC